MSNGIARSGLDKPATQAYLLGSLALRGSDHPDMPARARRALAWYRDVVSSGRVVPFALVYDLGWLLLEGHAFPFRVASEEGLRHDEEETIRAYQNAYLNALLRGDDSFRRAAEAIARDPSRDDLVARAVALLVQSAPPSQVRLNSAVLRAVDAVGRIDPWAESERWDEASGKERAHLAEFSPVVDALVMRAGRRAFGEDDLSEIENWSAYRKAAQRLAGRRIAAVSGGMSPFDPRRIRVAQETGRETEIQDSGTWAEGGYVGVTTKGAIESLVPSELAYLGEEVGLGKVDLFQLRDAESQLLYYERDQGELQRHRRVVHVAFAPDAGLRVTVRGHKDQLAVGFYGLVARIVKDLDMLFREDSLLVEVHLVPKDEGQSAKNVQEDADLLAVLLRNEVASGTAEVVAERPGFDLAAIPPDPKAIIYWVSVQLGDDAPAGMPRGGRESVEAVAGRRPPRAVVVKLDGARPKGKRARFEPHVVWLPLDRDDGTNEPVPLDILMEDARDDVLALVAGGD